MTFRTALAGAAGLVALALVAVAAPAADAGAFRHHDATGDVVVTTSGSAGTSHAIVPTQLRPDFQKLTLLHTRWIVSVATTLRGLDGIDDNWTATIVTSKGDRFQVSRSVSTGSLDGFTPFVKVFRNGYHFKCDGIYVSRTSTGVIAKLPTRCLGNPWKVRVGVLAYTAYGEGGDPEMSGDDDVLRTGAFTDRKPALSHWIAR